MNKNFLVVGITILFLGTCITPSVAVDTIEQCSMPISNGKTLYVGGSGGDNYTTIQSAIDNANSGDTVYVYDDSSPYYERVVVDKSINLIGEEKNTTVIDGNYMGCPIIILSSSHVKVNGFNMINPESPPFDDWDSVLIKIINCHSICIEDNIITQNYIEFGGRNGGIYLKNSLHNIIRNNIIYNTKPSLRSVGIMVGDGSNSNWIYDNEICRYLTGIRLCSNDNTVYGNNINHNDWGIVFKNYADRNEIINNIITANTWNGILINIANNTIVSGNIITNNGDGGEFDNGINFAGSNNIIKENLISNNNPIGIYIEGSNNHITDNHISNNKQIGAYAFVSDRCIISRNNFIDNGNYNACFDNVLKYSLTNRWRNNYWSDDSGILFYKIKGFIYLWGIIFFRIPWRNIDWRPAKEPYDIEGVINL